MTGRERRARSASVCPFCSGPIRVGDPVRPWRQSLYRDAHVWCARKDIDLDAEDTLGVVGAVTG